VPVGSAFDGEELGQDQGFAQRKFLDPALITQAAFAQTQRPSGTPTRHIANSSSLDENIDHIVVLILSARPTLLSSNYS
jgi:hypothetical protein